MISLNSKLPHHNSRHNHIISSLDNMSLMDTTNNIDFNTSTDFTVNIDFITSTNFTINCSFSCTCFTNSNPII